MNIEELKALEQAATPGPWKQRELICFGEGQSATPMFRLEKDMERPYPWENDGKLIVILRNLAPELIALVEALEIELDDMNPSASDAYMAFKDKLEAMK